MEKPRWAKYYPERWDRIVLHYDFLNEVKESHGSLWCEYCGKENLILYKWDEKHNRSNMATVDHFLPKSKYPTLANEKDNFIVACTCCNELKKDDIWIEEQIRFSRKEIGLKKDDDRFKSL